MTDLEPGENLPSAAGPSAFPAELVYSPPRSPFFLPLPSSLSFPPSPSPSILSLSSCMSQHMRAIFLGPYVNDVCMCVCNYVCLHLTYCACVCAVYCQRRD